MAHCGFTRACLRRQWRPTGRGPGLPLRSCRLDLRRCTGPRRRL